ncbi:hypothetical protein L916_19393, partial [Phytophthora nicotianae]
AASLSLENALQPSSPQSSSSNRSLLYLPLAPTSATSNSTPTACVLYRLADPLRRLCTGQSRPLASKLSNSEFPDASPSPLVVGVESSPAPSLPSGVNTHFPTVTSSTSNRIGGAVNGWDKFAGPRPTDTRRQCLAY